MPARGREACVFERRERIDRSDHRAFVIHCAAAVDAAVFDLAREGFGLSPAVARGHNVQMAEDGDHLLALAVFAPADMVIHVMGAEAQTLAQRERLVQAARNLAPVGARFPRARPRRSGCG